MNQRPVITSLEVHIGRIDQASIHDHVDAIGLSERRNCTGLAIFEKAGEFALGGKAKLSIELPVDRAQIYLVRGGYHCHQVAVVILQQNAFRQLISRD